MIGLKLKGKWKDSNQDQHKSMVLRLYLKIIYVGYAIPADADDEYEDAV